MVSEKGSLNQGRIIDNLNLYLQSHNLPVRMNKTGICNGLASVYTKYAIQGKEDAFFSLLKKAEAVTHDTALDLEVNHFVVEIVLTLFPETFDKESNPLRSLEILEIDGQHLKPAFELGMVTHQDNWAETIETLDLKEDEAMNISNPTHTVSVSKKKGEYTLYDPNYDSGFEIFSNEKTLVEELHNNVFKYDNKAALGMSIQVARNPTNKAERSFPEVNEVHEKYLIEENINQATTADYRTFNTLDYAIRFNQNDVVNQLIEKGAAVKSFVSLAELAIMGNRTEVLENLLDRIPDNEQKDIPDLFATALQTGHKKAFDILIKHPTCKLSFNCTVEQGPLLIQSAAVGGNKALLEDMIERVGLTEQEIANCILSEAPYSLPDAVGGAMCGGNVDCVALLVNRLDKANLLTEEKVGNYLVAAIAQNKPHLVDFFVDTINKNKHFSEQEKDRIFSAIRMPKGAVQQTDLSILRTLKDSGVKFSREAQGIIKEKENKPIGVLLSMGIMLDQFTDFMRAASISSTNSIREAIQSAFPDRATSTDKGKKGEPSADDTGSSNRV